MKDTLREELAAGYYKSLLPFAESEQEKHLLEACIEFGSPDKAAPHVKMHGRTVRKHVAKVKARCEIPRKLVGTLDTAIPEPLALKGTSTLYDAETGQAKISWVKTDLDKEKQFKRIIGATVASLDKYKPLKKIKSPRRAAKDLLPIVPLGDPHVGMYAWKEEVGEDFDCDIAEKDLRNAVGYLMEKTPPSETCVILNLGDFFHSDNQSNRTARAGNALDVDTRWARVLQIGITLMIDCIEIGLKRHKKVIVKNNIGNHDDHTSQVLSICLQHVFKDNPRVEIANPSDPFFALEFGLNGVFSTHSHMAKPAKMQGIIANYYPEIWGRTQHRLALLGHWHHEKRIESDGLVTEICNTLASSDAWHHASGFRSKRNLKAIILEREEGEVERYTYNLPRSMLQSYKV
jgi:hypothetical protein